MPEQQSTSGSGVPAEANAERERLLRELRVERERLQNVFAQAPAAISVSIGPEHRGLLANEQFRRLSGRDTVGKTVREGFPDLEGQGFFELLDQVYATGEPYVGNEMFVRFDRDGDGILEDGYFNFVYQPLKDADGNVYGIMSHNVEVTDLVTARQHLEQQAAELEEAQAETEMASDELQRANAELELRTREAERARAAAEEANRAKTEFLAAMSHELRTPLNAIGGYTELLQMGIRGEVNEQQKVDLDRIRKSQQYLLGLINDILNFARIEAGQVQYDIEDVPVDDTLREMRTLIEPQLHTAGLTYEYRPGDSAVTARADRERMEQIVLNLLTNAVKFTDAGGRVVLGWSATHDTVQICVEDTGRGIRGDKLSSIFEPFVQVDRHRTRESQQGVGLGLAISRDLARTMRGDLTAQSTDGSGSTFSLTLPRAPEPHAGDEAEPTLTETTE